MENGTAGNGVAAVASGVNEVVQRVGRRRFSDAYKVRIVEEANRCTRPGEVAALLRREGLYSSSLASFRKQYSAGLLSGSAVKRKADRVEESHLARISELERENRRLHRSLRQAQTVIEVQKKLSDLLGISLDGKDGAE